MLEIEVKICCISPFDVGIFRSNLCISLLLEGVFYSNIIDFLFITLPSWVIGFAFPTARVLEVTKYAIA